MTLIQAIRRILGVKLKPRQAIILPPDTSLLALPEYVPFGYKHGVEVLNDNATPMEFVVSALQDHVGLSKTDAIRTMLEIHWRGGADPTFESAR